MLLNTLELTKLRLQNSTEVPQPVSEPGVKPRAGAQPSLHLAKPAGSCLERLRGKTLALPLLRPQSSILVVQVFFFLAQFHQEKPIPVSTTLCGFVQVTEDHL